MKRGGQAQGFTLIELLLALALGAMLALGAAELFDATQRSYRLSQGQARLQENGRFALAFLTEAVQPAGLSACEGLTPSFRSTLRGGTATAPPAPYNLAAGLGGYDGEEGEFSPSLQNSGLGLVAGALAPSSDVLVTRTLQEPGLRLVSAMPQASAVLFTEPPTDPEVFSPGALLVLSDCRRATLFQMQGAGVTGRGFRITRTREAQPAPGNFTTELYFDGSPFEAGAMLQAASVKSLFIAPGAGGNNRDARPLALFQKGGGAAEELVEGIEDLQLRFAVDENGDGVPERYLTAGAVADFATVRAVEISVLATSVDVVGQDGDGVLRRRFTTTVTLRRHGS